MARRSNTPRPHDLTHALEALERRALLDASGLPFVAYYPEGYVHDGINEFVPITNPNDTDVYFELWARYEVGERDQFVGGGTIAANTRAGLTLNSTAHPEWRLVRPDTPYALELRASAPLGATMSHYDFGTAIGESFTTQTATEWSFAEGYKDPANTRDFLTFYNPSDEDAYVAVLIYTADGQSIPLLSVVGAQRRGGWNLNDEPTIPDGPFSVQIVSSTPIVAAMSHYEMTTGRGFGAIGTPGGGSTAGVIPAITYDPGNRGADPELVPNAYISVLNQDQDAAANVTFSFVPIAGAPAVDDVAIAVPSQTRGGISIRDLNLPPGEYGVVYRSDLPVTATASVYQGHDGTGMQAITTASTQWDFGEGYMSRARAGTTVTEDLYIFNPGAGPVEATVSFFFLDGQTRSIKRTIESLGVSDVNIHELPEVLDMGEDVFFGVRVSAPTPVAASFEHWDDDLGGGFATPGTPTGELSPMAMIPIV